MKPISYNNKYILIAIMCICSNISLFTSAQETINTFYPYASRDKLSPELPVFRDSGETILKRTLTFSDKLYHESPKFMIRLYIEKDGVLEPFRVNQVSVHRTISASPRSLLNRAAAILDDSAYFQMPDKGEFSGLEYLMIEQGNYNPSYYIYKGLYSGSVYKFGIKNDQNRIDYRIANSTFYIVTPAYTSSSLSYEYNIIVNQGIDPPEIYSPVSISGQFVNKGLIEHNDDIQYDIYVVCGAGESRQIFSGALNDKKQFKADIKGQDWLELLSQGDHLLVLCKSYIYGNVDNKDLQSFGVVAEGASDIPRGDITLGQIGKVYRAEDYSFLTIRLVGDKILDDRISISVCSASYPEIEYNFPFISKDQRLNRKVGYFLLPGKYKVSVIGIGGKELKSIDIDIEPNGQHDALEFDLEL